MINLCNAWLPNDKAHAYPADTGRIITPIPVIDRVLEVDVRPIITIVSTDFKIAFGAS